jgi:hypothetical protein
MTTQQNKVVFLAVFALLMLLLPGAVFSQGSSPVEVKTISLSPTTFKSGDNVTVTVTLHNASTNAYSCSGMKAYLYVFKAKPYLVTNRIWSSEQAIGVTSMAAGESRTATFTQKFTVPAQNYPQLFFNAWGPICAPDEFGQSASLTVGQECVYKVFSRIEIIARERLPKLIIR